LIATGFPLNSGEESLSFLEINMTNWKPTVYSFNLFIRTM